MNGILALKLILSPTLIALVTLAGRRWGSAVSGWLAGLPITGGPILLVIALEHGESFAAAAARSTLTGLAAFASFCVAYSWTALRSPWWIALFAGYAAYASFAPLCASWHPSTLFAALGGSVALIFCGLIMPRGTPEIAKRHSRWELPMRMIATGFIVVGVTGLAKWLGESWSGVLTVIPTAATVLGVFTQRAEGPYGASRVLRALLFGMLGFVACLTVIAAMLERWGITASFSIGLCAALTTQGTMLAFQLWQRKRQQKTISPSP